MLAKLDPVLGRPVEGRSRGSQAHAFPDELQGGPRFLDALEAFEKNQEELQLGHPKGM